VGKGSHTNWTHPYYFGKLTVSGQDSDEACGESLPKPKAIAA
jgi:hypothetical protein